jgi:hypothetical protein
VAALIVGAPETRDPAHWLATVLLGAGLIVPHNPALAAVGVAALVLELSGRTVSSAFARRAIILVSGAVVLILLLAFATQLRGLLAEAAGDRTWQAPRRALSILAAAGLIALLTLRPGRDAGMALGLSGALFVVGALGWDQRSPWMRQVMQGRPPMALAAPVLWGYDANPSWFYLRQPAFVSYQQGAGLLFSRRTALAWRGRAALADPLIEEARRPPACASADPPVTAAYVARLCQAPDAPGAIVTRSPIPGVSARTFETPIAQSSACRLGKRIVIRRTQRFYAANCPPA